MTPTLRDYRPEDQAAFQALLRDPSLAPEFGWLQENHELDDPLNHPFAGPARAWIAEENGGLVGFATAIRFTAPRGDWALLRVGVVESRRRSGLGRALLDAGFESLRTGTPPVAEIKISHREPNPGSESFARAMGFEHDRYFWSMIRPSRERPVVEWPVGIATRTYDGTEQALTDWNDSFNAAFASNAMTSMSTLERVRSITQLPHFRAGGLLLAYRDGRCVGFCRCGLHPGMGDVDVLGVVPEARGIGLGRALVRWGVSWLLEQNAATVELSVDAENARAADLYKSEGFEVEKARRIWKTTSSERR